MLIIEKVWCYMRSTPPNPLAEVIRVTNPDPRPHR